MLEEKKFENTERNSSQIFTYYFSWKTRVWIIWLWKMKNESKKKIMLKNNYNNWEQFHEEKLQYHYSNWNTSKKRSLKKKWGRFLYKMGSLNLIQKFNSLFRFAIKSIDLWLLVNQSVTFMELLLWNNWHFHLTACQWLSTSIFIETAPSTWKCELHFIYSMFLLLK